MLYLLLAPLAEDLQLANLFRYITFRTGMALFTGMVIAFAFGKPMISWLRKKQGKGQPIRTEGIERHVVEKAGRPTMGGFLILIGVMVGTLLWADLTNPYVWIVIFVTAGFGLIGFIDDYLKVTKQSTAGFGGKFKLAGEFIIALIAVVWASATARSLGIEPGMETSIAFPFFKDLVINLGPLFFVIFTLTHLLVITPLFLATLNDAYAVRDEQMRQAAERRAAKEAARRQAKLAERRMLGN